MHSSDTENFDDSPKDTPGGLNDENTPNAKAAHSTTLNTEALNTSFSAFLSPNMNTSSTQYSSFVNHNSTSTSHISDASLGNIISTNESGLFQNTPEFMRTSSVMNGNGAALRNSNNNSSMGPFMSMSPLRPIQFSTHPSLHQNVLELFDQNDHHHQMHGLNSIDPGLNNGAPIVGPSSLSKVSVSPDTFFKTIFSLSPNVQDVTPSKPSRAMRHITEEDQHTKEDSVSPQLERSSMGPRMMVLRSPLKDISLNSNLVISPTAAKTIAAAAKKKTIKKSTTKKKNSVSLVQSPSKRSSNYTQTAFTTPLKSSSSLTKENIIKLCPNKRQTDDGQEDARVNSSPTTIINSSAMKAEAMAASSFANDKDPDRLMMIHSSPTRIPAGPSLSHPSTTSNPASSSSNQELPKLKQIPTQPKLGTFTSSMCSSTSSKDPAKPNFSTLNIILSDRSTFEQQSKQKTMKKQQSQSRKSKAPLKRAKTVNGTISLSRESCAAAAASKSIIDPTTSTKRVKSQPKRSLQRSLSQPTALKNPEVAIKNIDPSFTLNESAKNVDDHGENSADDLGTGFKSVINDTNPNIMDVFRD
ncbi:hypothetical protein WICPIJ_000425 [Wickerhamomyces pijperi]|uniref:Uncharacterized protein n=1 Tax=Wickerhamomyces pijperi TaxID=599730 RepID=A0A9P8TSK7_WICPI|nr:hypothetical protein WICPIJ_000425 [Wickerhamomyces pijperi]